MKHQFIFVCLLVFSINSYSQDISGEELLEKAIQYHDPKGKWEKSKITLNLKQETPSRPTRLTTTIIDNKKNTFWQKDEQDGQTVVRNLENDSCFQELNGKTAFTDEEKKKHRLDCKWTKFWRDYQSFLYGLPMKLKDPGTIVHEEVKETTFQKKECLALKITYDEAVGKDTWYFYFHPKSFAMIGYRFFHDESKNDGEYITLEGEVKVNGMRLPQDRKWYINMDDKYLGQDYLMSAK